MGRWKEGKGKVGANLQDSPASYDGLSSCPCGEISETSAENLSHFEVVQSSWSFHHSHPKENKHMLHVTTAETCLEQCYTCNADYLSWQINVTSWVCFNR